MDELENRIDALLFALDTVFYEPPSSDLALLISLLAKKVDEYELSEMMKG